jgi:hypothetical protein
LNLLIGRHDRVVNSSVRVNRRNIYGDIGALGRASKSDRCAERQIADKATYEIDRKGGSEEYDLDRFLSKPVESVHDRSERLVS